jgi:hypothetical protein
MTPSPKAKRAQKLFLVAMKKKFSDETDVREKPKVTTIGCTTNPENSASRQRRRTRADSV